jgi:hypothetical protein
MIENQENPENHFNLGVKRRVTNDFSRCTSLQCPQVRMIEKVHHPLFEIFETFIPN